MKGRVAYLLVALAVVLFPERAACQTEGEDSLLIQHDNVKEGLVEQVESEIGASSLVDHLQLLEENPFDLNSVTAAELETIPDVTPAEANAVIAFRKRIRKFSSARQVEVIEGIGPDVFEKIRKYVVAAEEDGPEGGKKQRTIVFRTRVSQDLRPEDGAAYRGSVVKSYSRAFITPSNSLDVGVLFEKDAGERFGDGFVSGFVEAKNIPGFSRIVLGDFTLESGQGLVLWSGHAFGKGSDVVRAIRKSSVGIRPYKSSDEFSHFRGAAAMSTLEIGVGVLELTLAASARNLPASVDDNGTITSLYDAGLFRTESELRKKNQLKEQLVGGAIHFVSDGSWTFGGSYYQTSYNTSFSGNDVFDFVGDYFGVFGLDARVASGRLSLFGEAAQSKGGSLAGIAGGILELSRRVNVAFAYRQYSPGFHSPHAAGFGEYDRLRNERGYYLGMEIGPTTWLKLKGYVDRFSTPWRTALNPLPSSGTDLLLQADAKLTSRLELSGRYSKKTVAATEAALDESAREQRLQVDRSQDRGRLNASYQINKSLRVRGRIEATFIAYSGIGRKERGYLIFQDLHYRHNNVTVQFRLIFFQTDSYDSRVYEYENDLKGVSSIPALYGKGRRYYLLVGYSLGGSIVLSAKYAETQKEQSTVFNAGSPMFSTDVNNRFSVQLDIGL